MDQKLFYITIPIKKGEKIENYLSNYNHGTLILNIKESGIEKDVIKIIKKFGY